MAKFSILVCPARGKGKDSADGFTIQCESFVKEGDYLVLEGLKDGHSEVICLRNVLWYNVKKL